MVDLLAADCPRVVADKPVDRCGVYYPDGSEGKKSAPGEPRREESLNGTHGTSLTLYRRRLNIEVYAQWESES
jgi:hypothetical protein